MRFYIYLCGVIKNEKNMKARKEMRVLDLRVNTVVYLKWDKSSSYLYEGYDKEKNVFWFRLLGEFRPLYYAECNGDERVDVDVNFIESRSEPNND